MAKYTGPACRQCRREGVKMFLKGERCFSDKCPITRRGTVPGQHGAARARMMKEYGLQLRAKQRARRYYGVNEVQFSHYFEMAKRKVGVTGENLLKILESRLDNVVYRMGMAQTRREARQLVVHGHFRLNGKKVNIPSMLIKTGDVITLKDTSKKSEKFKALIEELADVRTPAWLSLDKENIKAEVTALPKKEDVDFEIEEHLIVELYSK